VVPRQAVPDQRRHVQFTQPRPAVNRAGVIQRL